MKLLLQAGIHLIKKVITFVIYGRSVQVFKACTLFYFFPAEFFFSQIFLRGKVLSHRFHRYTQIFFIMIFLHRISRMNRRHSCLPDYSRIFAELWPLANGSRPIYAPVVLVTQISQMTQIFLCGRVLSHRFHRYTQIFFIMIFLHRISRMNRRHSCLPDYSRIFAELWPLANGSRPIYAPVVLVTQISQMTQIFLRWRVLSHRFHRFTQIFYGISGESLCPVSGGICNDRTGRICENP